MPFKKKIHTPLTTGNTQLGLKISQLPSVYPAALGQCPATRPFSLPSFEPSTILRQTKSYNERATVASPTSPHWHRQRTEQKSKSKKKGRGAKDAEVYNEHSHLNDPNDIDNHEFSSHFAYKSAEANRAKFAYNSNRNKGYVYNCGFVPTVLNRALNVNVIGDELETLCSNFGNEHGGTTGLLLSKEQFIITAGRDRVVRYWDLQQPQKSFRVSNTAPNTIFTYNAYKDKKFNEVVFEELIEFEEKDYANLNEKQDTATISSSTSQLQKVKMHDAKSVHQDIITDLKAIEYPQNMLLTSSRNGIVKVWI